MKADGRIATLQSDNTVRWIGLAAWRRLCQDELSVHRPRTQQVHTHAEIVEVEATQPRVGSDFERAKSIAEELERQLRTAINERDAHEIINPLTFDGFVDLPPTGTFRWMSASWSKARGVGFRVWARLPDPDDDRLTVVAQIALRTPTHTTVPATQWSHR